MSPRHLVRIHDLKHPEFERILKLAEIARRVDKENRSKLLHCLPGVRIVRIFKEPSSRTWETFGLAGRALGANLDGSPNPGVTSSDFKGEDGPDGIMTRVGYADAIVIRHPDDGFVQNAAEISPIPIIDAGSGSKSHTTQGLLDYLTIRDHYPEKRDLVIAVAGDPGHSRAIRSLVEVFAYVNNTILPMAVKIIFVALDGLQAKPDLIRLAESRGITCEFAEAFTPEILRGADVFYLTREQTERHSEGLKALIKHLDIESGGAFWDPFMIGAQGLTHIKPNAIILDPLPRKRKPEDIIIVDADPRAKYFTDEVLNGLYIRMAVQFWALEHLSEVDLATL